MSDVRVQVDAQHVHYELSAAKFSWDHPKTPYASASRLAAVQVVQDPYEACSGAHAICVLTEWDEFKRVSSACGVPAACESIPGAVQLQHWTRWKLSV